MVGKRLVSVLLAGMLALTTVNVGTLHSYATEADMDAISIEADSDSNEELLTEEVQEEGYALSTEESEAIAIEDTEIIEEEEEQEIDEPEATEPEPSDPEALTDSSYYTITYVFGTEEGNDPIKNTGYYHNDEAENPKRLKQYQIKVPVGSAIGEDNVPDINYIRNTDAHYRYDYCFYTDVDRSFEKRIHDDELAGVVPTDDMTLYAGYRDFFYVVTFHNLDETAYFTRIMDYYPEEEANAKESKTFIIHCLKYVTVPRITPSLYLDDCLGNTNMKRVMEGLYLDPEGTKPAELGANGWLNIDGDTDVYIKWKDGKNIVTFDINDKDGYFYDSGNWVDVKKQQLQYAYLFSGDAVDIPRVYVRNSDLHKHFLGWSTNKDAKEPDPGFNCEYISWRWYVDIEKYVLTDDVTFYAIWDDSSYVINLKAENGTFCYTDPTTTYWVRYVSEGTVRTGLDGKIEQSIVEVKPNDSRATFEGWFDGDYRIPDITTYVFTKDTTLVAKFSISYTIKLDSNGGQFAFYNNINRDTQWEATKAELHTNKDGCLDAIIYDAWSTKEGEQFDAWYWGDIRIDDINSFVFTDDATVIMRFVSVRITLDTTQLELTSGAGVTAELNATLAKEYEDKKVIWDIADKSVATVSAKEGTDRIAVIDPADDLKETKETVVTATIEGTDISTKCYVKVRPFDGVLEPYADLVSGSIVTPGTFVNLVTNTPGAEIFYTIGKEGEVSDPKLDAGGNPVAPTQLYKDAISIDEAVTIKAIAASSENKASNVVTFKYKVSDIWRDIPGNVREDIFGGDLTKVPEGVWLLVDGKLPDKGITSLSATYTGEAITADDKILVFHNTRKLENGRDYTVSYKNNVNAANASDSKAAPTATIKGIGSYNGTKEFKFTILAASINRAKLTSEELVTEVQGSKKLSAIKPVVAIDETRLSLGKDYELKCFEGENAITGAVLNDPDKVYTIKIVGKGNYYDTLKSVVTVKTISKKAVKDKSVVQVSKLRTGNAKGKAISFDYEGINFNLTKKFDNSNGNENAEAFVYEKIASNPLVYGKDYTIVSLDADTTNAGIFRFAVIGQGKYVGEKIFSYEIKGMPLSKVKIAGLKKTVEYMADDFDEFDIVNTADKNLPEGSTRITLYYFDKNKKKVILDYDYNKSDYTIDCRNDGSLGKFTVTFTGIGYYYGTVKKTVTVKPRKLRKDELYVYINNGKPVTFVKSGAEPKVVLKFDGETLTEGVDYSLSFKNNTKIGDGSLGKKAPTVVIKGLGNFAGTLDSRTFPIKKASISQLNVEAADVAYKAKGKAGYFLVKPKLTDGGKAVAIGKDIQKLTNADYKYTYSDGSEVKPDDKVEAGTIITVSVNAKALESGPYTGEMVFTGQYRVVTADISKAKISVDKSKLVLSGKGELQLSKKDLTVTLGSGKKAVTLKPEDYDIVSITGNKGVGTATLTIRGRGSYGGTRSVALKITSKGL